MREGKRGEITYPIQVTILVRPVCIVFIVFIVPPESKTLEYVQKKERKESRRKEKEGEEGIKRKMEGDVPIQRSVVSVAECIDLRSKKNTWMIKI